MAFEVVLPELSSSTTEADLIAWHVKPGDRVRPGELIAELETDKSTVELEAEVEGTVTELVVEAGTSGVAVGTVLARIERGGGAQAAGPTATAAEPAAAPAADLAAAAPTETPAPTAAPAPAAEDRTPATALARRIAGQEGVDLGSIQGSGAGGRITKADVRRALDAPGAAPEALETPSPAPAARAPAAETLEGDAPYELVPASRMRRTIARRLSEAKREVPHFYLRAACEVDTLLAVRKELNGRDDGTRVSVNDFIVRALALALIEIPDAHVAWSDDGILRYGRVDISVAVATDGGLITPVVRGAESKGLRELSEEIRDLATRARDGKLSPTEYQGGTFSVSNLGMFGIDVVYPILNPPQAGILGVGAAEATPVVKDGEMRVATRMSCMLAADHRAIDGAVGARLMAAVKRRIEDPLTMLL